jgi:flagellar motor switch protein FliN/FliY
MSDAETNMPGELPGGMDEDVASALRAAQEAVSQLRQETSPTMASAGEDNAAAEALLAAQQAVAAVQSASEEAGSMGGGSAQMGGGYAQSSGAPTPQAFGLPAFGAARVQKRPEGIDMLSDVNLNVKIELGRTRMLVEDVLRLGEGSVVELDKLAGDPVDVYVNDRHVARGEVLVLNDNFCVRINEIVSPVMDGGPGAMRGGRSR